MDDNARRLKRERSIVRFLVIQLERYGWKAHCVDTGDDSEPYVNVSTLKSTLDEVFSVDTCTVTFRNQDGHLHGVLLTLGNDIDVICDWSYGPNDVDRFSAAMDDITDKITARYDR